MPTPIRPEGQDEAPDLLRNEYPLPLSAQHLSWITEEAEGTRDRELVLVEYKGKKTAGLIDAATFDDKIHANPIAVQTNSINVNRVKVEALTLKAANAPPKDCPVQLWDCLFWSEASIEKFFLPYYLAHRLLEPLEIEVLKNSLKDPNLIGFAHFTPSRPDPVHGTDTGVAVCIEDGKLTSQNVLQYVKRRKERVKSATEGA